MLVILRTIVVTFTASMKTEKNLDESHANSKEAVPASNAAASAVSVSQCGVRWRKLNVSDFAEKMCVMLIMMRRMMMPWMMKMI